MRKHYERCFLLDKAFFSHPDENVEGSRKRKLEQLAGVDAVFVIDSYQLGFC